MPDSLTWGRVLTVEETYPEEFKMELKKMAEKVLDNSEAMTGVKFDKEKIQLELISPFAMEELGKVLTFGAKKYAARNWEKGIAWSRIIGSLERHLNEFKKGNRVDPETGLSHLSHALCNAMFLSHYEKLRPEFDDLPKYTEEKK